MSESNNNIDWDSNLVTGELSVEEINMIDDITILRSMVIEKEKEIQNLKTDKKDSFPKYFRIYLTPSISEKNDLMKQLPEKNELLNKKDQIIRELEREKEMLAQRIKHLEDNQDKQKKTIGQQGTQLQQQDDQLEQQKGKLKQQKGKLKQQEGKLKQQKGILKQQKGKLKQQDKGIDNLTTEIFELKCKYEKLESKVNNLASQVTELIGEVKEVKTKYHKQHANVSKFVYATDLAKFYLQYRLFPLVKTKYETFEDLLANYANDEEVAELAYNTHKVDLLEIFDLNRRRNEIVHPSQPWLFASTALTVTKLRERMEIEGFEDARDTNISKTLCNLFHNHKEQQPTIKYRSNPNNNNNN